MSFRRGNGIEKLMKDLEQAKQKGLLQLKKELEARADSPGPSDPGEYPGVDTGEFAGSFFVTKEGVGNSAPHAVYLEFKSPSEGGRQPFSRGAADEELQASVARAVAKGVKGG